MALSIATNTGALMAAASATSVNKDLETSMERLSTGKRINSASDDAAGVAIASRLTSEIKGTNQAIRNAQDGQALIDTAEGAHKEVETILQRMRELAVQSSNDTNDTSDRANLQAEFSALATEINRIAGATTWAGQDLLSGAGGTDSDGAFNIQVGGNTGTVDTITVTIGAMTTSALGEGDSADGSVTTTGVDGVTGVTGVKQITNTALAVANVNAATDVTTLNVGGTVLSYTAVAATETLATIVTGLQADADYAGSGITIAAGSDGTSIDVTYTATGVQTDAITIDATKTSTSATVSTTGASSQTGVDAVTAVTAQAQISSVDASAFEVDEGDVFTMVVGDVTLTYTATSTDTSIADVVTGLQTDDDYDATVFVLSESSDKITATYTDAEAQADTTITFSENVFDISDRDQATAMIDLMDAAIATVNTQRAELGATSNRLDNTVNNLTSISIQLEGGRGRIEDADFAAESTSLAKSQILQQASTAMLAQANASKQSVLSLLQG
jgi:flagellin